MMRLIGCFQRRLSMMERVLGAIQAKLDSLEAEASEIEKDRPLFANTCCTYTTSGAD
ncbi:MAG: hypothetical protein GY847_35115 [Proteobacteria bacterium]|nr:hypothetical protein [Pseudomonadota bacterium]